MIAWNETHRKTIRYLESKLLPILYKEIYHNVVVFDQSNKNYGENTDPIEKFRQHYSDFDRPETVFIKGGYIGLRRWFPDIKNKSMLFPDESTYKKIVGNLVVAYNSGYESAKREPFMKDHFKDAFSITRKERRRRALIVEGQVKSFFETNYPEFYRNPSNHQKYEVACEEDFYLKINGEFKKIDVKTPTYNENGFETSLIRNLQNSVYYLFADLSHEEETVMMCINSGLFAKTEAKKIGQLYHISHKHLTNIECLLVALNLERIEYGLYNKMFKEIKNNINRKKRMFISTI